MKKLLFFFLIPFLSYGQVQIGQDIDGEGVSDNFGESVALSSNGNILAIGASGNDGNGGGSGHVRVYENQNGIWTQLGEDIDGEAVDDESGISISLSEDGNIVVIGAWRNDGNGDDSGHVRVYVYQEDVWVQVGLDIDGEALGDNSGRSVSLSADGNIVAIGAMRNDGNGEFSGHVRVYENQENVWMQLGQDIDGEDIGDQFGRSVSLSSDGSVVAIGAADNDGNGDQAGHVRVYENQGDTWVQVGQDIDGESPEDRSGHSVSLSSDGSVVAIGAFVNEGNGVQSGHVRVYENQGDVWVQIGEDIDREALGDQSGHSVSLSSDGNVVVIGAIGNDGNGPGSGHVRVYENQGDIWTQVGEDIDGEATNDLFGFSVSLSSDGRSVAIGAFLNDGNGNNSGHVRVFDLNTLLNVETVLITPFSFYPNPTNTQVTIQLERDIVLEKTTIYNSLGQIVKTSMNTTIDISDLSQGLYIIEVLTNQGKSSQKLIVE